VRLFFKCFHFKSNQRALTGVNDLRSVEHLEMIVDTSETSLGNFGIYLPSLKQLKLNGSHVPRIRYKMFLIFFQ
jgi:hypothetical protein